MAKAIYCTSHMSDKLLVSAAKCKVRMNCRYFIEESIHLSAEWLRHSLAKLMVVRWNLTMSWKLDTICCLHDGSLDDKSVSQLIKRLGVYYLIYVIGVHKEHGCTISTSPTIILCRIAGRCNKVSVGTLCIPLGCCTEAEMWTATMSPEFSPGS